MGFHNEGDAVRLNKTKDLKGNLIFDYIVVGTGPSGSVLATTLSDDRRTSVLVLEAGDNNDRDLPIRDSSFAPELEEIYFPQYFWQGLGVPQEALDERTFEWTTGRLAGGGSSINGEQYVRPTAAVFKEWEKLLGPMWSPRRATQTFKRLEKYNGESSNDCSRGFHGKINIRQAPANPTTMAEKLVFAIERATGIQEILDYNDPSTPIGPFTRWQLFQKPDGNRESASTAFLGPDIVTPGGRGTNGRKLKIVFNATALRVLFTGKRAAGVLFLREGQCRKAYARKGIILSAGINSAQLLMLSGIGPARMLRDAGIPVVFSNPNVGKNLANHTLNFAVFSTNPADRALPSNDPDALYTGGAFLPDPSPGANAQRRGVQLVGIGTDNQLTIAIIYLRPASRGTIQIQNADPLKIVLADEAFLTNPSDLEAVKNIYKIYIRNIAAELNRIDPAYRLVSPSPDIIDDDDRLEAFIRETFAHNHHQQSSLRMAPLGQGGVVDSQGRVHGVRNLIVADDSIVPFTVDGNTSAPAFLIGWTIAKQLSARRGKAFRRRGERDVMEE